jgi:hypothetical protein
MDVQDSLVVGQDLCFGSLFGGQDLCFGSQDSLVGDHLVGGQDYLFGSQDYLVGGQDFPIEDSIPCKFMTQIPTNHQLIDNTCTPDQIVNVLISKSDTSFPSFCNTNMNNPHTIHFGRIEEEKKKIEKKEEKHNFPSLSKPIFTSNNNTSSKKRKRIQTTDNNKNNKKNKHESKSEKNKISARKFYQQQTFEISKIYIDKILEKYNNGNYKCKNTNAKDYYEFIFIWFTNELKLLTGNKYKGTYFPRKTIATITRLFVQNASDNGTYQKTQELIFDRQKGSYYETKREKTGFYPSKISKNTEFSHIRKNMNTIGIFKLKNDQFGKKKGLYWRLF